MGVLPPVSMHTFQGQERWVGVFLSEFPITILLRTHTFQKVQAEGMLKNINALHPQIAFSSIGTADLVTY